MLSYAYSESLCGEDAESERQKEAESLRYGKFCLDAYLLASLAEVCAQVVQVLTMPTAVESPKRFFCFRTWGMGCGEMMKDEWSAEQRQKEVQGTDGRRGEGMERGS